MPVHNCRSIFHAATLEREGAALEPVSRPAPHGTLLFVGGLVLTGLLFQGQEASEVARAAALGVGVSLVFASLLELHRGCANLFLADIMSLCALYFLTFVEFLFPQHLFDLRLQNYEVVPAVFACLWGYAGLAVGRHFKMPVPRELQT